MKKTRIIQRTVSTFLAAAMLATLASCNAKLPGSRESAGIRNQPRQIMNYYTSEMLTVPEGFGYTDKIFCNDENIYVLGSKSSDSAEIISGIYDFEAKKIIETDFSSLKIGMINSVEYSGKDLVLSYRDEETHKSKIAVVDSETYEMKSSTEFGDNAYVAAVTVNGAGEIVTVIEEWGMNAQKYTVKTLDPKTLEEKSSTDITEALAVGNNGYLSGVVFDKAGDLYTLASEYDKENDSQFCRLIKLKTDGTVVYTTDDFTDLNGEGIVFKRANGNVCVASTKNGRDFSFDEIDNSTGAVKGRYDINLTSEIRGICLDCGSEADFMFSDESGIWKVDIEKEKPEKFLSFGTDLPESYSSVSMMSYADGKLFLYGQEWGDGGSFIFRFDKDGSFVEEISQEYKLNDDGEEESSSYVYEIKEDGTTGEKTEFKVDTDGQCYIERIEKTNGGDYAAVVYIYSGADHFSFVRRLYFIHG